MWGLGWVAVMPQLQCWYVLSLNRAYIIGVSSMYVVHLLVNSVSEKANSKKKLEVCCKETIGLEFACSYSHNLPAFQFFMIHL